MNSVCRRRTVNKVGRRTGPFDVLPLVKGRFRLIRRSAPPAGFEPALPPPEGG